MERGRQGVPARPEQGPGGGMRRGRVRELLLLHRGLGAGGMSK